MPLEFLKHLNFKPLNIFKAVVLGIFGVSALVFVFSMINSSVRPLLKGGIGEVSSPMSYPAYDSAAGFASEGAMFSKGGVATSLSLRNMSPIVPPMQQGTVGNNAEDFEVTDYSAFIETRDKKETCSQIADLKSLKHVIFEVSSESDRSCNFTFKVEHARAAEILAIIKSLKPKDLTENTQTIKRQLDDFTNQTDILKKKLVSIEETLQNALSAYDQITALAVKTQDASSLAKIIDSKVQLIERLTQERININQQLDYLARAKADQMDKLDYTFFNVNVYENKYVDVKNIKDSWKAAIKDFFYNVNQAVQDASINLLAVLFIAIPYIIYCLLLLVGAKYGWRLVKYIWKK
ncbi:MAG: hypothetical protein A2534_04505 [Candidatus Magasanikbacteria bacterium RIFOXYD2_FULL_39_9]|uniref:DUF4349 domain-containing protein n=1 Tax=Candidatus Magasanikbacteria bacterium RIFOXYD1_FULL_40_23 TaxID=1798705 RepID=A0A1F6P7C4_9BACT|nr:MAG: hypothetical protein A2534_04505 [Candidatus Magasanikbacteria bacterium RIFOXYD2_FULL_39_9]OGH92081.1 MAG: hypothetical protein A2563_00630 [Candidatus Magasanikbacteria bacterium RIFOXYD1_FULL_40_23]